MTGHWEKFYGKEAPLTELTVNFPAFAPGGPTWLGRKEPAVRQQLRELCYEATAKRGATRCALAVEPCFVPLLAWVVDQWEGTQLALALDATT